MPGAETSVIIEAPIETVYDIITDFERYPEFLPETREVDVIEKNETSAQVEFVIKVIKKIRYTLDYTLTEPTQVAWTFIEGDSFRDCHGSWTLVDQDGVTDATYHVDVSFGLFVPKKITEILVGKNLPNLMQAFKERAEHLG